MNSRKDNQINSPFRCQILLTGATGAVGAHILTQLLDRSRVKTIFCLMRGGNPISRLHNAMKDRGLSITNPTKLSVYTSDLSRSDLGLGQRDYTAMTSNITHIIHCAWPVNFQLGLDSFEPHIAGVRNLLQMSLAVPSAEPARFIFCSSITSAMGSPMPAQVPEAPIEDLPFSSNLGYGRSKLVAEHVIQASVETANANATILRIGQIVGDQNLGMWNENEMIPMIVRSGLRMGKLPNLDMECEWLPVDTLAEIILEVSGILVLASNSDEFYAERQITQEIEIEEDNREVVDDDLQTTELVYNIRSPHTFSWSRDFLPALATAGLEFERVPFSIWLDQLESFHSDATSVSQYGNLERVNLADGANQNPALKILEYLRTGFHEDSRTVVFEIDKATRGSPALKRAPNVVDSGLVNLMVKWWMSRWTLAEGQVTPLQGFK